MKTLMYMMIALLLAVPCFAQEPEPTPTAEEIALQQAKNEFQAVLNKIKTNGVTPEEFPAAIEAMTDAYRNGVSDATPRLSGVVYTHMLKGNPVADWVPYIEQTNNWYILRVWAERIPKKDYATFSSGLGQFLAAIPPGGVQDNIVIYRVLTEYIPKSDVDRLTLYTDLREDFPTLPESGQWAAEVFRRDALVAARADTLESYTTEIDAVVERLPAPVKAEWERGLRRTGVRRYLADKEGGMATFLPVLVAHPQAAVAIGEQANGLFNPGPGYMEYLILLRRDTQWGSGPVKKFLITATKIAAKNTNMDVTMDLAGWTTDAEGTDPLGGVALSPGLTAALGDLEPTFDNRLLRGEFAALVNEQIMLMQAADVGGDASAKKNAAENIARVLFSKYGTLSAPNAWLETLVDESWSDYDFSDL